MKKPHQKQLLTSIGFLSTFLLWTIAIRRIDVQPIGPLGSLVGFSSLNKFIHQLTGVHWTLYAITDWLGLVPLCVMLGFAIFGLTQWVKRKHLLAVDRSILVLGGFYAVVLAAYAVFEQFVVNYRPVLVNGSLEASYPSSTTLLVLTVMPTCAIQLNARIKSPVIRHRITLIIMTFTAFMVGGRFVSGVHWITDIIGGMLLSGGLVAAYTAACEFNQINQADSPRFRRLKLPKESFQ